MEQYYTFLMLLGVLAMLCIQLCVWKSVTLDRDQKRRFHLLYLAIAVASVCEWLGVCLQGSGSGTRVLHIVVKCIELSVAPSISIWLAWVMEKWKPRLVWACLLVHAGVECASGVFGFIFSVDQNSIYTHARYYGLYVFSYLLAIAYCICVVFRNIKRYQYNGSSYFLSTVAVMLVGIFIQLYDSQLRVVYFSLSLTSLMTYIFTLEMIDQTDALTQLINRRGYDNYISRLTKPCVILFFDVDRFKSINDTYGHAYGDQVLRIVGHTVWIQYARYGKCFRYGGDEFCVVLTRGLDQVERLNHEFVAALSRLREEERRLPFVSIGYASHTPGTTTVLDVTAEADQMMYQYKTAHRKERDLL